MEQAIKVVLIVVTFGLMVLVGLDLTPQSLRAALGRRRALFAGLAAPWLLIPPLVLGIARLRRSRPSSCFPPRRWPWCCGRGRTPSAT